MSYVALVEQASTPPTPPTGKVRVYINSGGTLSSVDDTGAVTTYSAGITQEQVEDYVGALLQDSSSVNVTYNDAGNAVTFDVIAGGVNHNALLNYVANQHIDHSAVSISAGTGLTGGGDITASRTISMPSVGTAGTYRSVTTDAQGRVTAGTNPTTLAGYGITDAQPLDSDLTAVAGLTTNGLVTRTGAGTATTRSVAAGTYMTVSNGDGVSGDPTVTHANSAVTAATYGGVNAIPVLGVGATGHVDSASTVNTTSALLTGLGAGSNTPIASGDTILEAMAKLQNQIDNSLGNAWIELETTADIIVSSNVTLTSVTELGFVANAGSAYYIEYTVKFRTAATTTGIALSIGTTDTAAGTIAAQVNIPITADGTAALYTGSITSFGDVVVGTGVQTAQPTWFIATIRASFICTAGGTVVPQFRSEVNGSNVNFGEASFALIREFA